MMPNASAAAIAIAHAEMICFTEFLCDFASFGGGIQQSRLGAPPKAMRQVRCAIAAIRGFQLPGSANTVS
jgi:hypothetical protein